MVCHLTDAIGWRFLCESETDFAKDTMSFGLRLYAPPLGTGVVAWALLSPVLLAQMGSWNVADKDLGRAVQPPFITPMGMVDTGKLATDPLLRPHGPVKEVLFEELRAETTTGGPAGEVMRSVKSEYDEQGRLVKEYESGSITIYRYDGSRLVSQESTFPEGKTTQARAWNYWKYDEGGKLIEYRRGRGDTIQNHETNFTRDEQGRLTGFEYHQGAKDVLESRTEFRYSPDGKSVDTIYYDQAGEVFRRMTQTMDGEGRVTQAVIQERDWRTKKPKRPMKVAFSYDPKGRVVEQDTESSNHVR